jgi:hypothetical protein
VALYFQWELDQWVRLMQKYWLGIALGQIVLHVSVEGMFAADLALHHHQK